MLTKVLIYSHAFAPQIGGVESYARLLAEGLAGRLENPPQVTVATRAPAGGMHDEALPFRVVREPGLATLLQLILHADLIHLVGPSLPPMLLAFLCGKVVTVEHHGYPPVCPNGLLVYEPDGTVCPGHFMAGRYHRCIRCNAANEGWVKSAFKLISAFPRRWLVKRAGANICITHHVRQRLELPRARVVYYGVGESANRPDANSAGSSPFCFAYVGRLVSLKGLPLLVEAAQHLKDEGYGFRLKFIGDGPERSFLEKLVEDRGLRGETMFTGSRKGQEFERLMHGVNAVVMPSVWEETAGLAAIEQMMRGKLVIAANIGGLGEVVGEAGLLFPGGDAQALAACMKRALESPDLTGQLGVKARQRALSMFRQDEMVENHLLQWQALVGATARVRPAA
jgi:glycosyltransferase involved in cell wall biosynthesis